ncbi:2-dehydro-3-deoxyphosphogluconate aldolase/(4S)-4-hydroxy-2-oxoglutarate aldolase [Tamaricihabitans halophyticus]|uniref:2-dehydro-3-deoxyphosphogluconate aldolase/(4S)-4-hydroxy-2-oxoglutarate aldolase n=1 Tax=Tamaricihabitans halophyticus TaxID=1262583 RepID=A0A4R2R9L4_9PSEU|nr:bifunctional 4-hydroxy-2-oxoglutarate aldolase/2-dehydro-3-deoxy-phosphogluconate aldolase [Tamaricihabitans halophyticus]TCP56371.1 2-dehydro-3-deoxyphosphogluconate aldolase/(4S)-4-hydroxy-2-oxoglutarate aldolase [Tamaricihabitans halophyticus]
MTSNRPTPGAELRRIGVVAILRGDAVAAPRLGEIIDTLVDADCTCLEVTLNTPGALEIISSATRRYGTRAEIGAGTVRTAAQARAAISAGARFLVAPDTRADVGEAALEVGLPWYPGAFTATEVSTAWELGAAAVKLFPANLGGPAYLRELRAPLDDVPLIPTGGVRLELAGDYLAAGALALGLGNPLLGDALRGGSLAELAERTRTVLAAVASGRERQ